MKNLDQSLGNQSILDESFSNSTGNLDAEVTATPVAANTSPIIKQKLSSQTISSLTKSPVPSDIKSAPESVPLVVPSATQYTQTVPQNTAYYGGGGGSINEEDGTKREGEAEKLLFGIKPKYVYVSAALLASVFIYFKFIKK